MEQEASIQTMPPEVFEKFILSKDIVSSIKDVLTFARVDKHFYFLADENFIANFLKAKFSPKQFDLELTRANNNFKPNDMLLLLKYGMLAYCKDLNFEFMFNNLNLNSYSSFGKTYFSKVNDSNRAVYHNTLDFLINKLDDKIKIRSACLIHAVKADIHTVKFLLDRGFDINFNVNNNTNALIEATKSGDTKMVALLLTYKPKLNMQLKDKMTALMWAAENNQEDIVKLLLDAGADSSLKDFEDKTALDLAKKPEIINLLINHRRQCNIM